MDGFGPLRWTGQMFWTILPVAALWGVVWKQRNRVSFEGEKTLFFHLNMDQIFMDQFGVVKPKFSDGFTSDLQSSLSASIGPSGLGHMCFKRGCKSYVDGIFKGDLGCQSTDNSVVRNLPPP